MLKHNNSVRMIIPVDRRETQPAYTEGPVVFSCTRNGVQNPGEITRPSVPQVKYFAIPEVETLWERYTPNSDGYLGTWKDFEHFKRVRVMPKYPISIRHYTDSYIDQPEVGGPVAEGLRNQPWSGCVALGRATVVDPFEDQPAFDNPQPDGHFVSLPSNWNNMRQASLNTLLPQIKPELSIINSLIELKDIKSQVARTYRNVANFTQRYLRSARKMPLRELLRVGSDLNLQYSFNVQPMLSDIAAVKRSLLRLERRINDLINRMNKPQKRYFTYRFREYDNVAETDPTIWGYISSSGMDYPKWYGGYQEQRFITYEVCEFHAVLEYTFRFSKYQVEHARLLGLLDSLGVNLNPAIIWNYIPWSFVIDWVWNVSSYLNQFRINLMEPQINIRNHSCSIKRVRTGFVQYKRCASTVWGLSGDWVPQPTVHETAYRRIVNLPTIASIQSSGLSPKEVVLGASLILSQRRRTRGRVKQ